MPAAFEIMTKPTIHVLCASSVPMEPMQQLAHGMEEEGVPWEIEQRQNGNAVALAWEASQASRLGVGLGADDQTIALHFHQLAEEQPLFQISARSDADIIRALGANAARLVKKLPLKSLDRR